jgi:hypothetical protein
MIKAVKKVSKKELVAIPLKVVSAKKMYSRKPKHKYTWKV